MRRLKEGHFSNISAFFLCLNCCTPGKKRKKKKKEGEAKNTMILKFPPVRSAFPISSPAALRLLISSRPGVSKTKLFSPQSTCFDKTVSPSTIATPLSKYCPTFPREANGLEGSKSTLATAGISNEDIAGFGPVWLGTCSRTTCGHVSQERELLNKE